MEDIYEEDYENYIDYFDEEDVGLSEEQKKMVARRKRIELKVAELLLDRILDKYNSDAIRYVDQAIDNFTRNEAKGYISEMKNTFGSEIKSYIKKSAEEYIDKKIMDRLRKIVE